jgi:hypothetical protein
MYTSKKNRACVRECSEVYSRCLSGAYGMVAKMAAWMDLRSALIPALISNEQMLIKTTARLASRS